MTIGIRLKEARKRAKLTQQALANLAGVTQARISSIEMNVQSTSSYVVELADALGVSPQWLKTGENRGDEDREFTPTEIKILSLLRQLEPEQHAREIAYLQKLVSMNNIL
tara:strand:+ start:260 stop:589 length:330 start_codon:yes stop_codon:yes gene_type:complete